MDGFLSLRAWFADTLNLGDWVALERGWPVNDWLHNLETMKIWFPQMDFHWSEFGVYYTIPLSRAYVARVACCLRLEAWKRTEDESSTLWMIDIDRVCGEDCWGDTLDGVSFLVDASREKSLRSWLPEMKKRHYHLWTELECLALAMELLWSEVFAKKLDERHQGEKPEGYGPLLGAWLAGLTIDYK